jgi:alkylation response protein AidB-like acyl-CoA dehydrogenase
MNFDLTEDQQMLRETFARFLDDQSSVSRVREAMNSGIDLNLWRGLADLGVFGMRVPEENGGLGLGTFDAALLMEEIGRTLATGPIAEAMLAARLLALLKNDVGNELLEAILLGENIVTLALHDISKKPLQWVPGGAVADSIIACSGNDILLLMPDVKDRYSESTLASNGLGQLKLDDIASFVLGGGDNAVTLFTQVIEEWKLLMSAMLAGLSREAIRLAAAYASERTQFGALIGTYQGISHPLADLQTEVDGGKLLVWKTIHDIDHGEAGAAALLSLSTWWNIDVAGRAVAQSLHTFGGYGLTTEYDIHLFNLRAKAWPLVLGDPKRLLREGARRLYAGETTLLPDVGNVSIHFELGEEAQALAKEVNDFFNANLTPELRAKAHYSWDGHDPVIHKKLAQAGLLFPAWPREAGGRAAAPYALNAVSRVWEKQGWGSHATNTTGMVGAIMRRFGSDEVTRDIFSKVAAGEAICSLGFSEPGSGSDVFAAQCRATRDGDDWIIEGTKMFTSGANIADYVLMLTRTNTEVPKHKGLTMFIVPLKTAGVTVQPVYTFQDERTNITFYDRVRIPDSYRLGDVDAGVKVMAASLEIEHGGGFGKHQHALVQAAEALCKELIEDGEPLINDRDAQTRLARAHLHTEISEMLAARSLWAAVEKKPNGGFGSMAKLFSSEKFLSDARDLLDLTAPDSLAKREGPAGFLNQCYRHAQGTTIYGGTSEIHRSQVAERALGLPRSRA